jgi:hypothetical protein
MVAGQSDRFSPVLHCCREWNDVFIIEIMLAGQQDMESRSHTDFAFEGDLPLVHFDQPTGDRQPETGAADDMRTRIIDLFEGREEQGKILLGNADAGVGNRKMHRIISRRTDGEGDGALAGKFGGVGEQIEQYLAQPQRIGLNRRQIVRHIPDQADVFLDEKSADGVADAADMLSAISISSKCQRHLAGFDFGHIQDLVDHLQQVLAIVVNCGQVFGLFFRDGPSIPLRMMREKPMMELSGVRSSCDMLARNCVLSWSSCSSFSFCAWFGRKGSH